MSALRLHVRARGWETTLARVALVGFTVHDNGKYTIDVERDGRKSRLHLIDHIVIEANDPRDAWLLREAVGGDWPARETYFLRRITDGEIVPVELRLGHFDNEAAALYVEHDMLDGRNERTAVNSVQQLIDVLLPLGPTNSIGYHTARSRIVDAFERLRPRTWAEVGVEDADVIANYECHQVTPDHVAHANAGGLTTVHEIIAGYGIPPFEGWIDNQPRSDPMTIADLRDIITDLPDGMHIALPGYELGSDPATHAVVRGLSPRRKIYWYEGVLGSAEDGFIPPRNFLCLWTNNQQGDVAGRLREAGIDATYSPEKGRWYSSGWSDDLI